MMEQVVRDWAVQHRPERLQALLLGATPEVASMRWPEGTFVMGMDISLPMAKMVWPGDVPGSRGIVCGNWLDTPRRDQSCDAVIGDGSVNCLKYPEGFEALARTVARVLRPNGLLVLRCYLQSPVRETAEAVYGAALSGSISSFHAFKLRLLMALQTNLHKGVAVDDVYRSWVKRKIRLQALPKGPGWELPAIKTIDFYKDSTTVYAFPTIAELRRALLPCLEEVTQLTPTHDMADRCPLLVFRASKASTTTA